MTALKKCRDLLIYLVGLSVIAVGINLSKLSGLGISPVSSIPGVLAKRFPSASLGSMVIVVYCVLVLAQLVVLKKDFKVKNILGVPVAIIFGLMVDFVGISHFKLTLAGIDIGIKAEFDGLMMAIPAPEHYAMKLVYLFASILVIGIGVFIYLMPSLVPMPAEGLAAAIASVKNKKFGNCKTLVDVCMIATALVLQIALLGGISSFRSGTAVVREGTVLSAICVGQVVKFLNKIKSKKKG